MLLLVAFKTLLKSEDRMPCAQSYANAVYFRLGVLAYSLFGAMKGLSLPGPWRSKTRFWRADGKMCMRGHILPAG